jgi:glutamate-1-semialdehyde 2,1-aminomutase
MLDLLRSENPYRRMEKMKDRLCDGLRDAAQKAGVPLRIQSIASMFTPFFMDAPATDYASALKADKAAYGRFFHGMLERGIYLPPAQWEAAFVAAVHSDRHLDAAISAAREAFRST